MVQFSFLLPVSARAGQGSSSHSDRYRPPHPLHPQGAVSSQPSQPLQLPMAHLIQGEGEKMGSPVLQGQLPHFQPNQVRKRAQSLTPRGSAFSALGVGEMAGAAPPLLTPSPGQISIDMSAYRFSGLQKPSSLGTGDREEDPGPKEFSNLTPRRGGIGKKQATWFLFPQDNPASPHHRPGIPFAHQLTEGEWERFRWCFLPFLPCFRPLVWRCWHSVW